MRVRIFHSEVTDGTDRLRGTAAIEFALATPFLLALIIGITEVGMASYESMQVGDAAEAGALYAFQHPTDSAGIQNAITNATGTAGISATPAPTAFCGCPGATGVTVGDCVTACASGDAQGHYVKVSASFTHNAILDFPGFPDPLVLTGSTIVRVQ